MKLTSILSFIAASQARSEMAAPPLFKETKCKPFFKNSYDVMSPWPKYCRVYMTSNPCNKYEMSKDGTTILSCDIAEMCMTVMATPKCT